ncbi:MAG: hypothetical protein HQL31_11575 [Planctomycetes bacterium]|nr:hypothetical protein [Planctomycetota bacterium]
MLDIEKPAWLQGTSLLPLVKGEADEVNEAVFAEVSYHGSYQPMRSMRTQRYKYIRRFYEQPEPMLSNVDGSPTKNLWMEHGWFDRHEEREALYDLLFDSMERVNLAHNDELSPVLEGMRAHLERWMRDTGDPLLEGDIHLPKGAQTTLPYHPGRPSRVVDDREWNAMLTRSSS